MPRILIGLALLLVAGAARAHPANEAEQATLAQEVGTQYMVMQTSANEAAQQAFLRGLALLHSFEYEQAASAFQAAQAADPGFVMAYWGEAMTHNHPLWAEQDVAAARTVLARLGSTHAERVGKARNRREAQWLEAVDALYGEGSKEARDLAYLARMQLVFESDPADIDARAFYGLAILGSSPGGRQVPVYMRAAGVLEEGFITHPMHPGILHYLIHSYDDPVHAPLGERMAERYSMVAPGAGHAQHMVSHIFNALGNWAASERANINADAVVDRQRAASGQKPTNCGHYNEWLAYALMQQGKDARLIVGGCGAEAMADIASGTDQGVIGSWRTAGSSYADIATRWGIETGEWPAMLDWPHDRFLKARFDITYGQLLAARGNPGAAQAALDEMKRLQALLVAAIPAEMPDETEMPQWNARAIIQGTALVVLAEGDDARGLALLKEAAEGEAAMPEVFGPPAIKKPSWELLGEELLARGRKADAAEAFRKSLEFAPRRKLSLEGLAQSAD